MCLCLLGSLFVASEEQNSCETVLKYGIMNVSGREQAKPVHHARRMTIIDDYIGFATESGTGRAWGKHETVYL